MSHTCGLCGGFDYHYFAIDEEGRKVKIKVPRYYMSNHHYSHKPNCSGWKRNKWARKQYQRHLHRIEKNII